MAEEAISVGTLDVLILKALSWGPMHGYGIGRWIRQTTEDVLATVQGASLLRCHMCSARAGWTTSGASPRPVVRPSTTA